MHLYWEPWAVMGSIALFFAGFGLLFMKVGYRWLPGAGCLWSGTSAQWKSGTWEGWRTSVEADQTNMAGHWLVRYSHRGLLILTLLLVSLFVAPQSG